MNQIDANERFIGIFGATFDRAHRRTEGADGPSHRVKNRVMGEIARAKERSETADPSAFVSGHGASLSPAMGERRVGMDMAMSASISTQRRSHSQWWSVLVAGAAVVLILATLRLASPPSEPGNGGNLAMAPGLATPAANACTAEPLTADEVMDMVKNPLLGYDRLGPVSGDPDTYVPAISNDRGTVIERSQYLDEYGEIPMETPGPDNLAAAADAKAATDRFWTCMLYGTSFQVWGLIAPEFVQAEILAYYPLFRTEEQVMDTILRIGPLPYSDNGNSTFFTGGSITSDPLVLQSKEGDEGVVIVTEGAFANRIAIVDLVPENPDNAIDPRPRRFLIQMYGEDQWIVLAVDWQMVPA